MAEECAATPVQSQIHVESSVSRYSLGSLEGYRVRRVVGSSEVESPPPGEMKFSFVVGYGKNK
jgi:hypothetical protein